MDILFTIVAFAILIAIIVGIHEGGHFLVGRLCGIKMLEFSLGFGPKVLERTFGKDKTLFTLRALPLGGFVKPLDETALKPEEWKALPQEDKNRSFKAAAKWKKILMVAGGPFANFVLAFVVYFLAMTMVGTKGVEPIIAEVVPQGVFANAGFTSGEKIEKINDRPVRAMADAHFILVNGLIQGKEFEITTDKRTANVNFSNIELGNIGNDIGAKMGMYFNGSNGDIFFKSINSGSPAEKSGLLAGDNLVSLNGVEYKNVEKAIGIINKNPNQEISLVVKRNEELVNLSITPALEKIENKEIGRIGVEFELKNSDSLKTIYYTPTEAFYNSGYKLWDSVYTTLVSIKKLIVGELSVKTISGPVAIADYSGKSAKNGLFTYMMMIAAISIAVGVFNLLPIPALDGGHLAQYAVETVIRKDFSPKVLHYTQVAGFSMIMGLFAFAMFNDISKYFI